MGFSSTTTVTSSLSDQTSVGLNEDGALRVLLLEDDPVLGYSLDRYLRYQGHHVDGATTVASARRALASAAYDCLVLDRLVADGDALDLVAELRERPHRPALLVLSGRDDVDERIAGLRAGADDYVAKPFPLAELALRVGNLGACGEADDWGPVRLGSVVLDRDRHCVTVDGAQVHLTHHQYAVLDYLVVHRQRTVPSEELLEHCWDARRDLFAKPVHSQVTRLRAIFRGRLRIDSIQRVGYALSVDDEDVGFIQPRVTEVVGR